MKKIKKIIKKSLIAGVVSLEIVFLVVAPTQASIFKPKSPSLNVNANGIAKQLEERYHVDKETVQDSAETYNVGGQKIPAPEVDLFFTPTNPKFGEKVTVTAIPKYFQEGKENMYFTWYIKHKGCEIGLKEGDNDWKASCDVNGDKTISVDDWKVEAMRSVASGGFIKSKADYASDNDNDGYRAHRGGRVNVQKTDYCYLHDFITGENYEIAKTDHESGEDSTACDGGEVICANDLTLSCGFETTTTAVPQYNMGTASSNSTANADGGEGTGNSEGSSSSGGSSSTSSSSNVNLETPAHEETTEGNLEKYYKIIGNSGFDSTCDTETKKMVCPEDTKPLCVKDEDLDLVDPTCDQFLMCPENPAEGTDCYKIRNGFATENVSCESEALTMDQIELECNHQFADVSRFKVGDGSFGAEEENFWGTDPHDPSTIDNENNDEANVAGLGMDKMNWTFAPGDKVGVIVEGQSYLPTKHDDASVAISFALVNNIFHKEGDNDCKMETGVYEQKIKNYTVKIPFAYVNIDNCLDFNLTSPTEGNQADNMEVTLDYYPKNPSIGSMGTDINGNSKGGDSLTITSNTSDPNVDVNQIYYKWSIYGFKGDRDELSLDKNAWTLLSNDEIFRKSNNIKLLEGLGMDQLEMQLNTTTVNDEEYNFLRFFVESEEFFDTGRGTTGTTRSGRGDILVEPNQSSEGGINIKVGNSTPICENDGPCEVLENQVITASLGGTSDDSGISNYLWTLDGKSITTLSENETKQGNSITFLLEGRPGDVHVLSMVANDTAGPDEVASGENKNKGEKLTLSKNFVVTKPMVGIGPNNKINRGTEDLACQDLNGNVDESAIIGIYSTVVDPQDPDAEPEAVLDCKENVFNGSGSVTITPTYYPEWIKDNLKNVKYSINGDVINDDSSTDCNNISCAVDLSAYPVGSNVNISFEAEYWQTDAQRVSLKSWGVAEGESGGEKISDSIMVKVGESDAQPIVKKASKIIAGLAYNIPKQMIFMFRLILTAVIVVFASGIIMSLGQKKYE